MRLTNIKAGDEILVRCRVVEVRTSIKTNWILRVALNGQTDESLDEQGNVRNESVVAVGVGVGSWPECEDAP